MGRKQYTEREAEQIRRLLELVRKAPREEQKRLRHALRKDLGFHISDWSGYRFTPEDFDALVRDGRIRVVG